MEFSFNLLKYFEKVVLDASKSNELFDDSFEVQIRVADERFGDFQANGVLPYAKSKNMNPRELAQSIINTLPKSNLWVSSIAGPGFINFKLAKTIGPFVRKGPFHMYTETGKSHNSVFNTYSDRNDSGTSFKETFLSFHGGGDRGGMEVFNLASYFSVGIQSTYHATQRIKKTGNIIFQT